MEHNSGQCGSSECDRNLAEEFERNWERCKDWIQAALEYAGGSHNLEDIRSGILNHTYQFWPAKRSAVVTQVVECPQKRILHIFLAGGDISELEAMYPDVEAYAKFRECQEVTLTGRKGWARSFMAKVFGFRESWVTLNKPL